MADTYSRESDSADVDGSGRATTGVVGGAVLFCSFLSAVLTRALRDFS